MIVSWSLRPGWQLATAVSVSTLESLRAYGSGYEKRADFLFELGVLIV